MTTTFAINKGGDVVGTGSVNGHANQAMVWTSTGQIRVLPSLGAYRPNGQAPTAMALPTALGQQRLRHRPEDQQPRLQRR